MVLLDAFSFGGGVQSTAALVAAAEGFLDCKTFIFANTGNDSESPATLAYFANVHKPYAEKHGIELLEVRYTMRNGYQRTLLEAITREDRSIYIPVRLKTGAFGNRKCTARWKIEVIAKELKRRGATARRPATLGIGISYDEWHRAKPSRIAHVQNAHPLLTVTRSDCEAIVASAGLPPVPKSSCWFCPFKRNKEWQEMRLTDAGMFEKACLLEDRLNEKREAIGRDAVFLSGWKVPLREIPAPTVAPLGEELEDECTGHCTT